VHLLRAGTRCQRRIILLYFTATDKMRARACVCVCLCMCDSDKMGAMKNSSWKTFHSQLMLSKEKTVMFADNLENGEKLCN